ncbi:MAG: bifunctional nuclease family protein [Chitinivibrionales bacterium]|nr:bifunctional nuclease family protein [Chitinivibrionales bacterium]MBD3395001.1 bifunctional nuclease family protein [Chitinivibrionales bacterium]
MRVPVEPASFAADPATGEPVVVLKAADSDRSLAIAIGTAEAAAIAMKSLDVAAQRPLTIDLAVAVIDRLGGRVESMVIYDLVEHSYLARINVVAGNALHVIDCRPSDAIALAMRCDAPMLVEDAVFAKSATGTHDGERDGLADTVAGIDTLDFGRYHLE